MSLLKHHGETKGESKGERAGATKTARFMWNVRAQVFRAQILSAVLLPAVIFGIGLGLLAAYSHPAVAQWPFSSAKAPARNVILFIGDGMGVSTVTAARIYDGQSRGETGEENLLSFEHFPQTALVKTYNSNQQVPDSAGTATAMNSGVKTRAGVINMGPKPPRGDCAAGQSAFLPRLADRVVAAGKAVGIVTTTRITHATPAAVYAHSPDRNWESDRDIPAAQRAAGCRDIAAQLIDFPFTVALGGGRRAFLGSDQAGRRLDAAADLLADWRARQNGRVITDRAGLAQIAAAAGPVLGLFAPSHLAYELERANKPRQPSQSDQPSLSEMTRAALKQLQKNRQGYFLMVESGRIDHGHHAGRADLALSETQEFAHAVSVALEEVDLSDTLILVTADHSHVFTIAGYPARGNPILGLARGVDAQGAPTDQPILAMDGKPYTTLGYQNGPGANFKGPRPHPEDDPHAVKQALVPTGNVFGTGATLLETHGGEDVALYATGPGADAVHGVLEQNRLFNIMVDALGL